jgi:hypothetical protein
MIKKKNIKKVDTKKKVIDSAIIWHAATFLSCQDENDSSADKQLRRAVIRHLKTEQKKRQ